MSQLCDDGQMSALVEAMKSDAPGQDSLLEGLLSDFPDDARLHFLKASILVGTGRLIEAYSSFVRTLELEPDFAIARFQLGFFQLTSGEAVSALDTWGRLDFLPDGHYLRSFVDGLRCLIRDDFVGTISNLRTGIANNSENIPLNGDMSMIIDQCAGLSGSTFEAGGEEAVSETALILKQFGDRAKMH